MSGNDNQIEINAKEENLDENNSIADVNIVSAEINIGFIY